MEANRRIYLSSPHMSLEGFELSYVQEAFDTNWIAPLGRNVDLFEQEYAQIVGVSHAAALSSGTAAEHLAIKAAGIQAGDIVFCQSLTFSASANPIIYEGAVPVFIGSNRETWNMDPNALEAAFRKYPNAKAVILVHLYGLSADIDPILEICQKYGAVLIEDAAESLGTLYKGKQTGTFGDYGVFSFNGNKIITTSGGGMLVSNHAERIEKARFWATQSREKARHYEHREVGYNYRMSNVVAGIGRGQLHVLDARVEKKRQIFHLYQEAFSEIAEVEMMPVNSWNRPNFWLSCIQLKGKTRPVQVMDALEKDNIESRPIWKPMHMQPVFKECEYVGDGVAVELFENGVCLPSDTKMSEEEIGRVGEIVKEVFRCI